MEEISRFRELEKAAILDVKNSNNIVDIRKKIEDEEASKDLRMACTHCLRRIFLHYIENKLVAPPLTESKNKTPEGKVAAWMWKQYKLYRQILCNFLSSNDDWSWELSVKTLLELTKKETEFFSQRSRLLSNTFAEIFTALLVTRQEELDADLLLIFRSEVFAHPDCVYHGLRVLFDFVTELKTNAKKEGHNNGTENMSVAVQNAIDLLRMIDIPDELSTDEFYIPLGLGHSEEDGEGNDDSDAENDDDNDSDDSSVEDRQEIKSKRSGGQKSLLGKRQHQPTSSSSSNKRRRLQNIVSLVAYQKLFSKIWIHALSLPMSMSMHKTLLKHISDHVLVRLHNPLLLADYLTQCYNLGGIVAVFALESLFTLILRHNLDYPHFFESLYRLCTLRVLNAKYGVKYMKLLHLSLRSTNMPAYLVAAFLKRLAGLALQVSAPRVAFCIAQITWLLRQHRTCQVLVHRRVKSSSATAAVDDEDETDKKEDEEGEELAAVDSDDVSKVKPSASSSSSTAKPQQSSTSATTLFVLEQDDHLETSGALSSSLWELEALEQHFLHDVAQLATALRDPMSTSVGNMPIVVEQYIDEGRSTYQELIDADLNRRPKRNAAMAYRPPTSLLLGHPSQQQQQQLQLQQQQQPQLQVQPTVLAAPPTTFAGKLLLQQEQAAQAAQGQRVLARMFDW